MKNKIIIMTMIIVFVFLLTSCGKQIEIKDKFSLEDKNTPMLNKLTAYNYKDSESVIDLELQSVEIKVDNSFKGKAAIVYKKDLNNEAVLNKVNEEFIETEKNEFYDKLINSIESIIITLKDTQKLLIEYFTDDEKEEFALVINEFELLLLEIKSDNEYTIDEMITMLNDSKTLVGNFLTKNANQYIKVQKETLSQNTDYFDTLEVLSRTYMNAVSTLPNYSGSKDYSGFYNEVVISFNDDIARQYNVNNSFDQLMKWAEDQIIANSNGTVDYLYIIKENKKAIDIEKAILASDIEYAKLNESTTYKNILTIVDKLLEDYKEKVIVQTNHLDNLKTIKKTLEDTKSIEIQNNITDLNKIKADITTIVEDIYIENAMNSVSKALDDIVKTEKANIKFDSIDSNENEIYVVFKFERLDELYENFYVNTVSKVLEDDLLNSEMLVDLTKIKTKYIINEMKSPELLAVEELLSDINYETESLKVIEIGLEATKIKRDLLDDINVIKKEYTAKANEVYITFESQLTNLNESEFISFQQDFEKKIIDSINNLNEEYKGIIDNKVNGFKNAYINYNKSASEEGIVKVLNMIDTYNNIVEETVKSSKTFEQITEQFNELYTGFFYFNEPVDYNIRLTLEGAIENKLNLSGKVDLKDNYQINAVPSGDNGVRIIPNTEKAMFLFTLKSFGSPEWKMLLISILLLLVILRIVSKKIFNKVMILFLLLFIATIVLYPVAWIIGSSFNKSQSLLSAGISPIPKEISFLQYERLFKTTEYVSWYWNTLKIAISNMILSVLLTVSTAYVFSRFKFKGKKAGLMSILILQIFPSFLGMVAIYILLSRITFLSALTGTNSLVNTSLGLILVYACGQIPYNTWIVKGYFDTIPRSLDEAARIDGASNLKAFWKIILPLGRPIISFVAITNFITPWMDFILPRIIIKSPDKKTLAMGLFEMIKGRSDTSFTMFAAGAVLVAIPITILFSYFQKYIVTGLAAGAVKG